MNCIDSIKKIKQSIAFISTWDDNKPTGSGSGFVYGKSGIVVTCNHVVKGSTTVFIKFPDSEDFLPTPAKIVLQDEEHDLALLRYEGPYKKPLNKGLVDNVQEGMEVIFSGYPLGWQDLTTHQGIISSIIKDQTGIVSYLIDGTVNSGNSGCPLMDNRGNVIGVVNAKRWDNGKTLSKIQNMGIGAVSLYGVDMVEIYQALANNVQIGVGVAVPASYIPEHKEIIKSGVQKTSAGVNVAKKLK